MAWPCKCVFIELFARAKEEDNKHATPQVDHLKARPWSLLGPSFSVLSRLDRCRAQDAGSDTLSLSFKLRVQNNIDSTISTRFWSAFWQDPCGGPFVASLSPKAMCFSRHHRGKFGCATGDRYQQLGRPLSWQKNFFPFIEWGKSAHCILATTLMPAKCFFPASCDPFGPVRKDLLIRSSDNWSWRDRAHPDGSFFHRDPFLGVFSGSRQGIIGGSHSGGSGVG